MMLWVNQGVVVEDTGTQGKRYLLQQDQDRVQSVDGMENMVMEDNTETAVSSDAHDAEVDTVIEQYLRGMLTNLGKLPLNRIHNTLKMFMSGGDLKYDKSLAELSQLLNRLCNESKLDLVNGEYALVK
ncbi:unnamed protein product [Choristocarpus tenellus]